MSTEIVSITKHIKLEPRFFDSNIRTNILNTIVRDCTNKCTKDYGHVLHVVDNKVKISKVLNNIFIVTFKAEILRLVPGKVLKGNVCMLFKDGIFIDILERQQILIAKHELKEYTFDEIRQEYKNIKTGKTIRDGDELTVQITLVKYSNNAYSCCGKLVKE